MAAEAEAAREARAKVRNELSLKLNKLQCLNLKEYCFNWNPDILRKVL